MIRTRWAAIGAAVAVTLGAGGIGLVQATSPSDAVAFVPIEPCRLVDTRPEPEYNVGGRTAPLGPNETLPLAAHGNPGECTGIPTTATGLSLNVTAVGPTTETVITIWGDGDQPNASNLNPAPGSPPTPNAVTSGLTAAGVLNVWNAYGNVHIIIDIAGYYTDHNHDDRYYTEAEVDAAVGAKANADDVYTKAEVDAAIDAEKLFGLITSAGTIRNGSPGLLAVQKDGTGQFTLTFDRDVSVCAAVTASHQYLGAQDVSVSVLGGDANQVRVDIRDPSNTNVDVWFNIIVQCP